jgi:hypothetical protein
MQSFTAIQPPSQERTPALSPSASILFKTKFEVSMFGGDELLSARAIERPAHPRTVRYFAVKEPPLSRAASAQPCDGTEQPVKLTLSTTADAPEKVIPSKPS